MIPLKKSKRLLCCTLFLHGLGLVLLWVVEIPAWVSSFASLLIMLGLAHYAVKYHGLWGWCALPRQLTLVSDEAVQVSYGKGESITMRLLPTTFVGEWLIVLHLQTETRKRKLHFVLLSDSFTHLSDKRKLAAWCARYFMNE